MIRTDAQVFEAALRDQGLAENTIKAYLADLRGFHEYIEAEHARGAARAACPADQIAAYMNAIRSTMSPATVRRKKASLRLYAELVHDVQVLKRYKLPRAHRAQAHPLPNGIDDVRAMLEVASRQHEPLIALCAFAGARVHEARNVRRRDITVDDDGVHWVRIRGKGDVTRDVPIVPEGLPWLDLGRYTDPDARLCPLADRSARQAITRAAQRAGISRPVSSHDLRMTFGTIGYAATKDLRAIQDLLGHSSPDTTARYTGVTDAAMKAVTQGVFG